MTVAPPCCEMVPLAESRMMVRHSTTRTAASRPAGRSRGFVFVVSACAGPAAGFLFNQKTNYPRRSLLTARAAAAAMLYLFRFIGTTFEWGSDKLAAICLYIASFNAASSSAVSFGYAGYFHPAIIFFYQCFFRRTGTCHPGIYPIC